MERVPFFKFIDQEHGVDSSLGYDAPKMVTFIQIAPHGHKGDPMEFLAEEFIERKAREAAKGMYDNTWVREFREGLAAFRDGNELPRSGTPLALWERLPKARREQLKLAYPTVEDLAAVPDAALSNIGMDGRVLRDLAKGDIQAKKDLSPVVKELAEAKENTRRLEEQMADMQLVIAELSKAAEVKQNARK